MNKLIFFKLLSLSSLLVVVLLGIRYFRSNSFLQMVNNPDAGLNQLLVGGARNIYDWCPKGTETIEVFNGANGKTEIRDLTKINKICHIEIESLNSSQIGKKTDYQQVLIAKTPIESRLLEKNEFTKAYILGGLPFISTQLDRLLAEIK